MERARTSSLTSSFLRRSSQLTHSGSFRAEDEANEKRRKRFAREHDLADVKERGGVVEMVPRVVDRMSGLTLGGSKGKKKFVNSRLGYGVEEPEPMFDPVRPFSLLPTGGLA